MLPGRGRIPPQDRLSLSHGEMPWEADVAVSAASGKIGDLIMVGSRTGSKKQTDKQREEGERTERACDTVHLSNYGITDKSCKGPVKYQDIECW